MMSNDLSITIGVSLAVGLFFYFGDQHRECYGAVVASHTSAASPTPPKEGLKNMVLKSLSFGEGLRVRLLLAYK
jgi:hypothetical protein